MARKREQIFGIVGALLFLISSFGLTIFVVWNNHQQDQLAAQQAAAQKTVCGATKPPANEVNVEQKGQTLQGTQLVDFTPCKVTSLQTVDIAIGTGPAATPTDTVTVNYTGAVAATGTIFQSSLDSGKPATFPLNEVIPGWTEGIPGMKVGGKRRLLIPAAEAYGANPPSGSGIPANADLVFDVTMLKISS